MRLGRGMQWLDSEKVRKLEVKKFVGEEVRKF